MCGPATGDTCMMADTHPDSVRPPAAGAEERLDTRLPTESNEERPMHARRNACRVAGPSALLVSALLVIAADPAIAADDPAELIGAPASVAITPAEANLSG